MRPESECARVLRACFVDAVREFDLEGRVERAVRDRIDSRRAPILIALGKSAAVMALGAMRVVNPSALVVARPRRAMAISAAMRTDAIARGVVLHEFATGHPVPDDESVRAAQCVKATLEAADADAPVIVLVSGGASAALCLPRDGLALAEYAQIVKSLLASGLAIESVNALRGRLDAMKHGGLARLARGEVHTVIAADVLGDERTVIASVGSGPTVERDASGLDAETIARLPDRVRAMAIGRTTHSSARVTPPVLVASPRDFRDALESRLAEHCDVEPLGDASADVDAVAAAYIDLVGTLASRRACIAIGEPTVTLPSHPGRGGRAGRLALELVSTLEAHRDVAFLAAASDGVDGESGHAGAVIDAWSAGALRHGGIDLAATLRAFDDARAHEAIGSVIDVGPTGLNLLDVHILARM